MTPADLSVDLPSSPVTAWPPTPGHRAPAALFVVTADHRVCAANETATSWFGPASALLPLARFLGIPEHDERVDELLAFEAELRALGRPLECRLTLRRSDQRSFSGLLMATPLVDREGVYLGFEALMIDLSRWSDRENLVPRTREESLARQLDRSERSLGLLRREMESFAQILGHDLRVPLRHVLAYLRLMRERIEGMDDNALLEYAQGLQQAAGRLGSMIEAMHDYLHLCRARLDLQDVPLGPLLQGVLAHLRSAAGARAIEWRIAPDLPTVRGDPMLLAQALRHLIENAIKFTRDVPRPVITLAWAHSSEGGFVFRVEDNGVGFDRQQADKLFLLFQRQHHSSAFEGLGVGLAMAFRIIERHGGQLLCETAPGEGCRMRFSLPDGSLDGPGPD